MKLVIIGAGGAGISALQAIRTGDKKIPITIISAERVAPYSLCALPYLIKGELPSRELPRLPALGGVKKNRIEFIQGSPVCRILPDNKTIILRNGKSIRYDRLLITTGSVPIIPPIEGIEKAGVFFLTTLASSRKIMDYIRKRKVKKAIVIGAGFTGIEAALSLQAHQIKVVIVEMLKYVLERILDEDMSKPLEGMLKDNEIELRLGEQVTKITGEQNVSGVRLKSEATVESRPKQGGGLIMGDLVLVSIGVKPNIGLVNGSGITVNRGILVDEYMKTNLDDIYAAGDVAEAKDFLTGQPTLSAIWPNAIEQGRVAALNMLGNPTVYEGTVNINVLNLNGCSIIGMGQTIAEVKGLSSDNSIEEIKYQTEQSRRKLILRDNLIMGFQSVGNFRHLGLIWSHLKKRTDISKIKNNILKDNFNTMV